MKAVANIWEKFSESKAIAVVLTLAVLALVGFGAPALVSAFQSAKTDGYTGTAVVQSHKVSGSFCYVEAAFNGKTENLVFGPKTSCYKVTDQMQVEVVKGSIQR